MAVVQAAALVNIYTDGTVLVTHGGVEMGQGLHTKMAQVIPFSRIPLLLIVHVSTSPPKWMVTSRLRSSSFREIHSIGRLMHTK